MVEVDFERSLDKHVLWLLVGGIWFIKLARNNLMIEINNAKI